jgi:hypothetical protein
LNSYFGNKESLWISNVWNEVWSFKQHLIYINKIKYIGLTYPKKKINSPKFMRIWKVWTKLLRKS